MAEARQGSSPRVILGVLAVVAAILLGIVLLFGVPLDDGGAPQGAARQSLAHEVVGGHPLLGEPAPEIDLETLDGERLTLSELRGRPVLVNFWATWCIPCRDEFPLMVAAYAEHQDEGLEILGVIHDDTTEGARRFAEDMGAAWPMLVDDADAAWDDYRGLGMPTSFFIDVDGVVRAFSLGGFTESGLTAQLAKILPSPPSPPPTP